MRIEIDVERRLGAFRLRAAFASDASVTALFGRSGCGKTTLLHLIAGLLRPDRGRIAIGERVLFDAAAGIDVPAERRRLGVVFQDALLLPHLSVRRNLLYGRFFTPPAERWAELDKIVALLDLGPLLERRPGRLSGGERQRVAIGRALLSSPRALLMDEPLASLDEARKGEILYYVERLRDEMRIPIVYVSHAADEIVRLADFVVELADGAVTGTGAVGDTIGRHGGGAVIEARVAEQDLESGLARLAFAGGDLYTPELDALPGERVRVRIAARDVALALSRPADSSFLNVLPCVVAAVEAGAGAGVEVRLDAGGAPLAARITRKSAAALGLAPGKRVFALVKAVAVDRVSVGYA